MKRSRRPLTWGLTAMLALTARAARAQGDQSDVISAHGDALARSTSAEALVAPKPAVPPNSAPPFIPATPSGPTAPLTGLPFIPPKAGAVAIAPQASGASPLSAPIAPAPQAAPPSAESSKGSSRGRAALIVVGALIALAMFLFERRRKD